MPRKHGHRVKRRNHKPVDEDEAKKVPHSIISCKGQVGDVVRALMRDWRQVMRPYTTLKLVQSKKFKRNDILNVRGQFGVTHAFLFSATDNGAQLRVCRVPRGPTAYFHVSSFTLASEVVSAQRRPHAGGDDIYATPPLVMTNWFKGSKEWELVGKMLNNSVPEVFYEDADLTQYRRVVLFNRHKDGDLIDVRHYAIDLRNADTTRSVRKLKKGRISKRLGSVEDMAQLLTGGGGADGDMSSDSEAEADDLQVVEAVRKVEAGKGKLKLVELGPRFTLELWKIEAGFLDGAVLHHKYIQKTATELADIQRRVKEKEKEKKKKRKKEGEEGDPKRKRQKTDKYDRQGDDDEESDKDGAVVGDYEADFDAAHAATEDAVPMDTDSDSDDDDEVVHDDL